MYTSYVLCILMPNIYRIMYIEGITFKVEENLTTIFVSLLGGHSVEKIWLDEFPMFINVFKGELKIFGVRPLSTQYFSLYKKNVQERRIKYKPGLVPPYYVDMPVDLDEIQASEMKYFDKYDRHPFFTDIVYFFKSFVNICFKHARSK